MIYKSILKLIGLLAPILYLLTAVTGSVLKLGYIKLQYAISDLTIDGYNSNLG